MIMRIRSHGEGEGAELEGEITDRQELDQARNERPPCLALRERAKPVASVRPECEFNGRAGDVPGEILEADQIVRGMVIERVGLDEPIAGDEPLPRVKPVVGAYRDDVARKPGQARFPALEPARHVLAEREPDIARGHGPKLFERGPWPRRRQMARPEAEIVPEMLDEMGQGDRPWAERR